jgi:pyrimidine deaminase RibD-like protein
VPGRIELESALSNLNGDDDRDFAQMAIEEARKSVPEDARPHPKVGAVVVKDGKILSTAYRGEKTKSHAEYVALDEKLSDDVVAGATVYTTLEPCTTRKHPKIPCAQRLVDRRVSRVVIGMLDPNPDIRGRGEQLLSDAGIEVQLFPRGLRSQVEEMNREFIRAQKQREQPRAGLATESDSRFLEQRKKLPETELLSKIWSKPRWHIWIRPADFKPARFQSLEQCREFAISSEVIIRGWNAYPPFSREAIECGDGWIACEGESPTRMITRCDRWVLYRSGQFTHNRTIEEVAQLGDRIHALEILDVVTAVFEFAARMSDRRALGPEAIVTLELHGIAGRSLTWPQDIWGDLDAVPRDTWCQDEALGTVRRIGTDELKVRARELAVEVAQEIYGKFGWAEPPVERLRAVQGQRFGAR